MSERSFNRVSSLLWRKSELGSESSAEESKHASEVGDLFLCVKHLACYLLNHLKIYRTLPKKDISSVFE